MITCDFCDETEIVYSKGGYFHLCKEHNDDRRKGEYEKYKNSYGLDPRGHVAVRGISPCKYCDTHNNCLCGYCSEHCLKKLDDLKDKNLFLFSAQEKEQ